MSQNQPLNVLKPGVNNISNLQYGSQPQQFIIPPNQNPPAFYDGQPCPTACPTKPACPPKNCEPKPACPPKNCETKPACPKDPCAKGGIAGWAWLGMAILWFVIFTVLFWLIYYSLKPAFVLQNDSSQVDTGKVLLAAVISSLILIVIVWLIKFAVTRKFY